jgi:uncharacterized membrane protein HdeD (DUF308 family)
MLAIRHSVLRSILGIVLGLLLILWPDSFIMYLVITTGSFFVLSGLGSILLFFRNKDKTSLSLFIPVVSVGSIFLGIWLALSPAFFVNIFMYMWGVLLALAGIQQLASLFVARKWTSTPWGYYILPALILASGVALLFPPFNAVSYTLITIGVVSLFYGLNELVSWYKVRPPKPCPPQQTPSPQLEDKEMETTAE